MKMTTCEVCTESIPKYKCPKCFMKYCSLPCFRNHKDEDRCRAIQEEAKMNLQENDTSLDQLGNIFSNEEQCTKETEDRVLVEKLQQLEASIPLKEMIENPHLRTIIKDLAQCRNPAKCIEKLMQEPLFLEFADECLETVETDSEGE